jgi:hypothetical protein
MSMLAQYVLVLSKKIRTEDNVPPTLPRQGRDQLLPYLHKAAWWLLITPPKNRVDGAGRQRRTSASSTHSYGPAPLLYEDYIHRRLKTIAIQLLGRLWQPLPQVYKGKEDLGAIKGGEAAP